MKIQKFFAFALVVLALLVSTNTIFSQDFGKETPEERAQKRAERLQKDLSLSDDQYKQVYELFLSQGQQIKALRESSEQDKTARKEKMKSIWQSTDASISGLLSSEQNTKYEQFKKERKEKHMQKKKNKKGKNKQRQNK